MPYPRIPSRRPLRVLAGTLCAGLAALPLASAHGAPLRHAGAGTALRRAVPSAPLILHARRSSEVPPATASTPSAAQARAAASQPLSPAQIRRAYGLPARGASHQTIAVISAFNDATVLSDLAAYDKHFALPACTEANGCLTVLNQQGKTSPLPGADSTGGQWVTESALGTELVHSLCQSCKVMLVEASFSDTPDFSTAAEAAAKAGANVVLTTFTPAEPDYNENTYQSAYDGAHETVVAATGDSGYSGGLSFPASLPEVVAVGGTNLTLGAGGNYRSETAWNGTTSGCSLYESAPSWQSQIEPASGCKGLRAGADVAAMSAPGAIIYASGIQGTSGGAWYQAEGTSVSAPIVAAAVGLAGSKGNQEDALLYARHAADPGALHDVTSGTDASGCTQTICKAGPGWDGPTGLGTPAGLEEFLPGGPALAPRRPRVTISAWRNRLALSRSFTGRVTVANGNPFRISGPFALRRTMRVHGRLRTIVFATGTVSRSSLQRAALKLTIRRSERTLLTSEHRLPAWLFLHVRGAAGKRVTVKHQLTLIAG